MTTLSISAVMKRLAQNKYVLLVLLAGLVLLLLPGHGETAAESSADPLEATGVSLEEESAKLGALLAEMDGVGRAQVLLSKKGAVVVCDGADSAVVRLEVTDAVMAYTGLGGDKISVMKMK